MPINPYQSPYSEYGAASEAVEPLRPAVPSSVLLLAMPLYFALNWAALRATAPNWSTFDLYVFGVPSVCLISLGVAQFTLRPFRWWALLVVAAFLVGMGALNRWLFVAAMMSV